jgi:hypothetical protein
MFVVLGCLGFAVGCGDSSSPSSSTVGKILITYHYSDAKPAGTTLRPSIYTTSVTQGMPFAKATPIVAPTFPVTAEFDGLAAGHYWAAGFLDFDPQNPTSDPGPEDKFPDSVEVVLAGGASQSVDLTINP